MVKRFFIALIKGYNYLISPFLGNNCRYIPSCSSYTQEAIQRHGVGQRALVGYQAYLPLPPFFTRGGMIQSPN